jgi:uncharacterized SAM-dependent methyltransferase
MLYFKKSELADTYHISEKTVTNWVKAAKRGKLALELHQENGRAQIANTTKNRVLIEHLIEVRKKYRNSRGIKIVSPQQKFYELYSELQVLDIISNLDIHREIPFQYGYFDGGAEYWDTYARRLASEEVPNFLTSTVEQLQVAQDYIGHLTRHHEYVNVIDIGPGNALPVRAFLQRTLKRNKLGRYVAVDISPSMLAITQRNIEEWFGPQVAFEAYEADINYDRFTEFVARDALDPHATNIILALGGTFANLRSPDGAFRIIHDSMSRNDLFVHNLKLDNEVSRNYFDFGINDKTPALDVKAKMLLDMLGIDESFYDVEMGFEPTLKERYIRIRLKIELTIKFIFEKREHLLELKKNEAILLWRYWHQDVRDVIMQLHRNEFDVMQSSLTEDRAYLLTISRIQSKR